MSKQECLVFVNTSPLCIYVVPMVKPYHLFMYSLEKKQEKIYYMEHQKVNTPHPNGKKNPEKTLFSMLFIMF